MRWLIYFVLGGATITTIAYLSSVGRTLFASFVAMVPVLTLVSFVLVYIEGGLVAAQQFARGLLIFLPGWVAYVAFIWLAALRLGFWGALAGGLVLFFALNLAAIWLSGGR